MELRKTEMRLQTYQNKCSEENLFTYKIDLLLNVTVQKISKWFYLTLKNQICDFNVNCTFRRINL